jgi:hypothetical protein
MSPERDLTIDSALADPMIRVAMLADRVNPRDFETLLRSTAKRLAVAPVRQPSAATALLARRVRGEHRGLCFA